MGKLTQEIESVFHFMYTHSYRNQDENVPSINSHSQIRNRIR